MPSLEQSERTAGAAFLSVPAFDAVVWMLDNWARMELLVKLQSALPPILFNPVVILVCIVAGLFLLHRSHLAQIKRVSRAASEKRRLVDTSGVDIHKIERPGWTWSVILSFVVVLLLVPILAVGYSLAYEGTPPKTPRGPVPPYFAFFKTERHTQKIRLERAPSSTPIAIAPNGIANAAPNFGNQTVNNVQPPRTIRQEDHDDVVALLRQYPGVISVTEAMSNPESSQYAEAWCAALTAAGWKIKGRWRVEFLHPVVGILIEIHGEKESKVGEIVTVEAPYPAASLVGAIQRANGKDVSMHRTPKVPEGEVKLDIGSQPRD